MPHRINRSLMLWFFIALQAMMPFIHAHAGAVQLSHSGFLHVHQDMPTDATWHATANADHGAEVDVADGRPSPLLILDVAEAALPASRLTLPRIAPQATPGAGLPAPPPRFLPPDHTLPLALAPPAA
ncbi:hypothetical protein [Thiobacillus sp.]|uniref:hypothetical protein n=1 Tax=Thiobacillus sp. TaxID=924 RepID=UPI0025CF0FF9|nr:hypothetical protein [Thiobacillus sp.]MBT9539051.1 hypothetical protein [Thiobacillus sp.]